MRRTSLALPFLPVALLFVRTALANDINVNPTTLRAALTAAQPGDTLHLAAGTYSHFTIRGLNGSPSAWITITGPSAGQAATIVADPGPCCNTIEIVSSSFVAIENLTIDGMNVDGAFGVSAKNGTNNLVHDIRIERCTFINHHGSQQHVAISTKTPTWGWVIRGNIIRASGTGIYLGNSDGTAPFVQGTIENNLIIDPIGYCMQIKYYPSLPAVPGLPTSPTTTLIRNNVFIKNDDPSPDGDRPSVLVGGFPSTGPGSMNRYEVYGNFFLHNPRESLFQASGRVTIHDNIFVDAPRQHAILLQDHDLPLELAYVYNNTIYSVGTGIRFGSMARRGDAVVGNLVFADTPILGNISHQEGNISDTIAKAAMYVVAPSIVPGVADFYPLGAQCTGPSLDELLFERDADYALDFNGRSKGSFFYRGAYAGAGTNPGWALAATLKNVDVISADGGVAMDAGTPEVDGGPAFDGGARRDASPLSSFDAFIATDGSDATKAELKGSCACSAGHRNEGNDPGALMPFVFGLLVFRRFRRSHPT